MWKLNLLDSRKCFMAFAIIVGEFLEKKTTHKERFDDDDDDTCRM